jgi:hypothetical protein
VLFGKNARGGEGEPHEPDCKRDEAHRLASTHRRRVAAATSELDDAHRVRRRISCRRDMLPSAKMTDRKRKRKANNAAARKMRRKEVAGNR